MSRKVEIIDGKLTCSKCKRLLPVECFSKGKNASGYRSTCKECVHDEYEAKKTQILARHRDYYERTKEHYLDQCKTYRETHKEERSRYFSGYYKEHAEEIRQRTKAAYENIDEQGLEKRRQYYHKRRATKHFKQMRIEYEGRRRNTAASLVSDLTEEQWAETLRVFDGCCAYCGTDRNITRDHIIPVSKGGGYTKTNIIPCCGSCNSKKHDRDFKEWYTEQPFFQANRLERIESIMEMG